MYYVLFEGIFGRTIGKMITGTKVIVKDTRFKPSFLSIIIRSLSRVIPFEFLTFFSRHPAGWHDTFSNTLVVKSNFPYAKPVKGLDEIALSKFRNKNIGFIFQFHNLLPEFTALENVCIPGYLGDKDVETVKEKARRLLKMLGLEHRYDHKPSELSGGEQQRVAIARALINDPTIVLADEPTGNLDSRNAEELHKLFFQLRNSLNQTFIIVTHNESLANMADRRLEMKDGKILQ
jgi:ABC-type lipoprotein export system ATPase subunit